MSSGRDTVPPIPLAFTVEIISEWDEVEGLQRSFVLRLNSYEIFRQEVEYSSDDDDEAVAWAVQWFRTRR